MQLGTRDLIKKGDTVLCLHYLEYANCETGRPGSADNDLKSAIYGSARILAKIFLENSLAEGLIYFLTCLPSTRNLGCCGAATSVGCVHSARHCQCTLTLSVTTASTVNWDTNFILVYYMLSPWYNFLSRFRGNSHMKIRSESWTEHVDKKASDQKSTQ